MFGKVKNEKKGSWRTDFREEKGNHGLFGRKKIGRKERKLQILETYHFLIC